MSKSETIRVRVDAKIKARAEGVLAKLGLSVDEAVRMFCHQIALQKGLPFDVKIPNATTRRAMKDVEVGKNLTRYESFDDFTKAIMED